MSDQIAWRMQLKAGAAEEYRRRHDLVWPELAQVLRHAGVYDYSIFLDEETLGLFAVMRLRKDGDLEALAKHAVMRQWWAYMAELMVVGEDDRPVEWPLQRVFRLD